MTRNWTDYPIIGAIPRKKIHLTELATAYEERVRFWRTDPHPDFDADTQCPLPTFYYDGSTQTKLWGPYPKADPAHWPPNQSPDNEVKNDHIGGARKFVATYGDSAGYIFADAVAADFYAWFCDTRTARAYQHYERDSGDPTQSRQDFLTYAIGQSAFTDDEALTAGSVFVKAVHINEIRDCLEKMVWVPIHSRRDESGYSCQRRYKWASEQNADPIVAFDNTVASFVSAEWSAWEDYDNEHAETDVTAWLEKYPDHYTGYVHVWQYQTSFNLDRDPGGDWSVFPPTGAKLITMCARTDGEYINPSGFWARINNIAKDISDYAAGSLESEPFIDDITDQCGSGHGEEWFLLSSQNNYSADDMKLLRPDTPSSGRNTNKAGLKKCFWLGQYQYPYATFAFMWCAILPDWQYGTA